MAGMLDGENVQRDLTVPDRPNNNELDAKLVLDHIIGDWRHDGMVKGIGDMTEMGWPGKIIVMAGEDQEEVYVVSVKKIR